MYSRRTCLSDGARTASHRRDTDPLNAKIVDKTWTGFIGNYLGAPRSENNLLARIAAQRARGPCSAVRSSSFSFLDYCAVWRLSAAGSCGLVMG